MLSISTNPKVCRYLFDKVDYLPPHIFDEIMHFFSVYKQLENKETAVKSLFGKEKAEQIIQEAIECYKETFEKE